MHVEPHFEPSGERNLQIFFPTTAGSASQQLLGRRQKIIVLLLNRDHFKDPSLKESFYKQFLDFSSILVFNSFKTI